MDTNDSELVPIQACEAPDVAGIIYQAYRKGAPVESVFNMLRPDGDASETREGLLREWLRFSAYLQQLQLRMDAAKE